MAKTLVVIDMQNYFVNRHTKDLPAKIRRYIISNRKKFDYIIFTQFVNKKSSNFVKLMKWKKCFGPPETDIHRTLKEFANDENTFVKHSFSPFKSGKFVGFVKRNRLNDFYLCGNDTEACVFCTAVDAFDSGYKVRILKDLCGSHLGKAMHRSGVAIARNSVPVE